jgi:hypothetical protein
MNPAESTAKARELRDNQLSLVSLNKHGDRVVLSAPGKKAQDDDGNDSTETNDDTGASKVGRVAIEGDCYVSAPCLVTFTANNSLADKPGYFAIQRYQVHDDNQYDDFLVARNTKEYIHEYLASLTSAPFDPSSYFTDRFPHTFDETPAEAPEAATGWDDAGTNSQTVDPTTTWDNDAPAASWGEDAAAASWGEDAAATSWGEEAPAADNTPVTKASSSAADDTPVVETSSSAADDTPVVETSSSAADDTPVVETSPSAADDTPVVETSSATPSTEADDPDFVYDWHPYPDTFDRSRPPFQVLKVTSEESTIEVLDVDVAFCESYGQSRYTDNWDTRVNKIKTVTKEEAAFRYLDRIKMLSALDSHPDLRHECHHLPSEDELVREFFYLKQNVYVYRRTNAKSMGLMVTHCKSLGWTVTSQRLLKLFQRVEHRVALGAYPNTVQQCEEKEEDTEADQVFEHLVPRAGREGAADKDEDPEAAREERRKMKNEARLIAAKRMQTVDPLYGQPDLVRPDQNTEVSVRIVLNAAGNARSNIKLKFKMNYIDPSKVGQPYEQCEVVLDEHNLRSRPCKPEAWEYAYEPAGKDYREPFWNVENLSDAKWDNRVAILTNTDVAIVREDRLQNPYRERNLLSLPYNAAHFSAGIFTARDRATESVTIQSLQDLLHIHGFIHIFYTKPNMFDAVVAVRTAILHQAKFDPLRRFLKDDKKNHLGLKDLKHPHSSPLFKARMETVYRDAFEFRAVNAIGAYFDHVSSHTSKPYMGTAAIVPVPGTHNASVGRYMQYEASFSLEESPEMEDLPKIKPGTSGTIVFKKHATFAEEDSWHFLCVDKGIFPTMDRWALYVRRAKQETTTNGWSEREPATSSLDEIKAMGSDFYQLANSLPQMDVTLFTDEPNTKDIKRILNAINSMQITRTDSETAKASKIMGTELGKGKNDHLLPRATLWGKLNPDLVDSVKDVAYNGPKCVKGKQVAFLDSLIRHGIPGSFVGLQGISGGGKTVMSTILNAPYAMEVKYTDDMEHDQLQARTQFSRNQMKQLQRKLELEQKKGAEAQGLSTDDLPEIIPDAAIVETLDGLKPRSPRLLADGETRVIDGQIGTFSQMNKTVDHAFEKCEEMIAIYATALGLSPRLGVRIHSNSTESNLSLAFLHPFQGAEAQDDLLQSELDQAGNDVIAQLASNFKYETLGRKFKGVRDKRVSLTKKSLASRTLELINEAELTPEIEAAFTLEERDQFENEAAGIVTQVVQLFVAGKSIGKETGKEFKRLMRKINIAIVSRAHHIGSTISMSMDSLIVQYCQFSAIWHDEASKNLAASHFSQFSQHVHAEIRTSSGDLNQLCGIMFGASLENPFQTAASQSPMATYTKRRMPMPVFNETRRFGDRQLLKIVQIINNDDSITAAPGSYPARGMHPKAQVFSDFLQRHYQKRGPFVIFNVIGAKSQNASNSLFSSECAVVAASISHEIALNIPDVRPVIITNYHATKNLLENMNEAKKRDFRRCSKLAQAKLIDKVSVHTTDDYQGQEEDVVLVCGAAESYQAHSWDPQRIAVYFSRGKYGLIFVNDTTAISLFRNKTHPLVRVVQWAGSLSTVDVDPFMLLNSFDSFDDVLAFHKLAPVHGKVMRQTDSRTHNVMFQLDDYEHMDEDKEAEGWSNLTGTQDQSSNWDEPSSAPNPAEETFGIPEGDGYVDPDVLFEQEAILRDINTSRKISLSRKTVKNLASMMDKYHAMSDGDVAVNPATIDELWNPTVAHLIADVHLAMEKNKKPPPVDTTLEFTSVPHAEQKKMLSNLSSTIPLPASLLLRALESSKWSYPNTWNFLAMIYVDACTRGKFSGSQVQQTLFKYRGRTDLTIKALEDNAARLAKARKETSTDNNAPDEPSDSGTNDGSDSSSGDDDDGLGGVSPRQYPRSGLVETPVDVHDPKAAETPVDAHDPKTAETPVDVQDPKTAEIPVDVHDPKAAETPVDVHDPKAAETPVDVQDPKTAETPVDVQDPKTDETPVDVHAPKTAETVVNK